MTVESAGVRRRPADADAQEALRTSRLDLVRRLVRDYGFSELDACQFTTRAVESPSANVCDTNHTCVAELRKEWLPARDVPRPPRPAARDVPRPPRRRRETAAAFRA
ncbi:hypothetical protein GCM10020295_10620 [Streptomyces cinereospinus]